MRSINSNFCFYFILFLGQLSLCHLTQPSWVAWSIFLIFWGIRVLTPVGCYGINLIQCQMNLKISRKWKHNQLKDLQFAIKISLLSSRPKACIFTVSFFFLSSLPVFLFSLMRELKRFWSNSSRVTLSSTCLLKVRPVWNLKFSFGMFCNTCFKRAERGWFGMEHVRELGWVRERVGLGMVSPQSVPNPNV